MPVSTFIDYSLPAIKIPHINIPNPLYQTLKDIIPRSAQYSSLQYLL